MRLVKGCFATHGEHAKSFGITLGARIRSLRIEKGFSQGEVEKHTRLLRCYLSRVECGHTTPRLDTLTKLADLFGVSLGDFFPRTLLPLEDAEFLKDVGAYELSPDQQRTLIRLLRSWTQ